MKKVILYCALAAGIVSLLSCARGITADDVSNGRGRCSSCTGRYTPTEISLTVKNETKKMLQSPVNKMAGAEMDEFTYYLIINENKTFSAIVDVHGTQQYDFCAGTFQSNGDTLNLSYYKNIKSVYLTDRAVVDNNKKEIYFLNTSQEKTTRLKILNQL
jgi:hypothetical protein